MKNRTTLALMEQLVMVLVFALAAAACLRVFVYADRISRETAMGDRAVYLVQNGAETLKACGGDFAEAARLLGGAEDEAGLTVSYEDCRLEMERLPSEIPGLGTARVWVTADGGTLFSVTVCWQEVGG